MKVGKWKVLGLAGVLAVGFVATSEAAQIKVSDETWSDLELHMKIFYKNLDKRGNSTTDVKAADWSRNEFSVYETELAFVGQITNFFQFHSEWITRSTADDKNAGNAEFDEGGINLAFCKEFQVLAGKIRRPFTRYQISSSYNELVPTSYFKKLDLQGVVGPALSALDPKDTGAVFHGDLFGGMLTYRIGVFNEDRSNSTKIWNGTAWVGSGISGKMNDKKNFEWNARIEFQPLMLGFKPESAATITGRIKDTYLGQRDIFTIGLGYHKEKHTPKLSLGNNVYKDLDRDGWTIDATFEKKFGNLVPNLQVGYISLDETHFYYKYVNGKGTPKKGDTDVWYVMGQLLYDQKVGLGKPAIAFRYEKTTADGEFYNNLVHKKDLTLERWGVALNYYIKGNAARISAGFDSVKYDDAAKAYLKYGRGDKYEDSLTDWYIYLQSMF